MDTDVIIVGAGLAGLVAACELVERGRQVLILDQENAGNLGGQAYWSFGGLFFVDSPQQRRMGIRDSYELALQDWMGSAAFDRDQDYWPRQWAQAYVEFAAGEKHAWLTERGLKIFPIVGWAERGGYDARGHGNSVPRFHITWGTGPALVDIFARRLLGNPRVRFAHRHRVDHLIVEDGAVTGVRGAILEPSDAARGVASSRNVVSAFEFRAQAVVVASGGIGGAIVDGGIGMLALGSLAGSSRPGGDGAVLALGGGAIGLVGGAVAGGFAGAMGGIPSVIAAGAGAAAGGALLGTVGGFFLA